VHSHRDEIHVLHVDDDPDVVAVTATFLEREDDRLAVETATGVAEARSRVAEGDLDCIVSDYDMPARTGIEFLLSVRADHPDLPFVLFTGKGSEEVASEAISAGVTDYLQKGTGTSQYAVLANRVTNAVEQYRSKRALEESQKRLSLFIEQSPLGVIEWDEDCHVVHLNDAAEDILGYDEADLAGRSWKAIVPEDASEQVAEVIDDLLSDAGGYHHVNENVTADGETVVCEWHNRVVTDEADEVVAIFSQFQDVSDRQEREHRLEALNEVTSDLLTAETTEAVAELGVRAARDILDLEANAIHLYDEDRDALVPVAETDRVADLIGAVPTFEGEDSIAWRAFREGDPVAIDDITDDPDIYNPDTPIRSELHLPLEDFGILLAGSPTPAAFDDTDLVLGEILAGNVATALDQVERNERLRQREAELSRQNDRLEEFASVVSHDLRNPLNVASGHLDLLAEDSDSDHVEDVRQAHERMGDLIDDLLTLAREGDGVSRPEPVALDVAARTCWESVATGDATLVAEAADTISADRSRLHQLLENLFRNSVEHGGDAVTVRLDDLPDGFAVADDGDGIDLADRESVFDAGYTTADTGSGFGLSIVEEVAEAHGWDVTLTESAAGGARFEITGVQHADD